ncbi:MAG TPA: hypothetical protein VFG50_14525 [Rhodothermales bacterium]|nr:hypothetical protein [Rhodothermales bacterium]
MRPNSIIPRLTWLLLLAVSLALPAWGQQVRVHASSDSVFIGEHFILSLSAAHDPSVEVTFPDPARGDTLFGDVVLLNRRPVLSRTSGGRLQVDSVAYEAAAFAVDTAHVPPLPVRFTTNEQTSTVTTPALAIPIRSTVPPDAQNIKDLAPIVPFSRTWWGWVILAVAILVGVAAWWRLIADVVRNRKHPDTPPAAAPVPYRSPFEEAEERLHRLEQANAADPQQVKPFYVELSEVVRTYLQRQFELPALEETSRELVTDLSRLALRQDIPSGSVNDIAHILEIADLVKFADHHPPAATSHALVQEAAHALREIEDSLQAAEAPEQAVQQAT